MTPSIVTPSLSMSFRRIWRRLREDPDSRSVTIGVLGVLLVHLLLFLIGPYLLRTDTAPGLLRPHASARQFNIEVAPDTFAPPIPKPPPPTKFVETNPDKPDQVPDKTNNFAAQNQQVAQEKPTPDGKNDHPAIEGQKEIHSTQIVTGRLAKPVERIDAPQPVEVTPQKPAVVTPKREAIPLAGFEKKQGDDAESYGSNIAKFAEGAQPVPEKIEGVKNAPLIQGSTSLQPLIDPKHPRPRPQIVRQQQVRPAIFEENKFGTRNIGAIGVDAKWSNYGQYLQKMIETVQIQWERILTESRVYPVSGTTAKIVFRMDKKGNISEIISADGTAGDQGIKNCTSAIVARAPYGDWTEDMIAVLGDSQEMTFTFYYQ
jgi:hypothetical protein